VVENHVSPFAESFPPQSCNLRERSGCDPKHKTCPSGTILQPDNNAAEVDDKKLAADQWTCDGLNSTK
jgi:hypothetical protein